MTNTCTTPNISSDTEKFNRTDYQTTSGTTGGKSFYESLSEALWDATLVDLPTNIILYGGLAASTFLSGGTIPFLAIGITFATQIALGTTAAFVGYTIRKTCNSYLNEGKHSMMCGAIGNGVKYLIKGIPELIKDIVQEGFDMGVILGEDMPIEMIKLTKLAMNTIIGAVNGALYEGWGDAIGRYIEGENYQDLFCTIWSIESGNTFLASILQGKDLLTEGIVNTVASVLLTCFISHEKITKKMIQEATEAIEELIYVHEPVLQLENPDL